jgi:hypothetical protein
MSPCVFSLKTWETIYKGWDIAEIFNVEYCYNPFNNAINASMKKKYDDKIASINKDVKKKASSEVFHNAKAKKLYALGFTYKCKFAEDDVYFAFSVPYSYNQAITFVSEVIEKAPVVKN